MQKKNCNIFFLSSAKKKAKLSYIMWNKQIDFPYARYGYLNSKNNKSNKRS